MKQVIVHILIVVVLLAKLFAQVEDRVYYFDDRDVLSIKHEATYYVVLQPFERQKNTYDDVLNYSGPVVGYYLSGEKYFDGYFEEGKPNLYITYFYKSGDVKEKGIFHRERYEVMSRWKEGEGEVADSRNGKHTIEHTNGEVKAVGELKNGERIAKWSFYYANGKEWKKEYYYNGIPQLISYTNKAGERLVKKGKGNYLVTYLNGQIADQVEIEKGLAVGQRVSFYPNGVSLNNVVYAEGVLSGEQTSFYLSGEIRRKCHYKGGILNGTDVHYLRGEEKKTVEVNHYSLMDHKQKGDENAVFYYVNNQKKMKSTWVGEEQGGTYSFYYPDGKLMEEGTYKENIRRPFRFLSPSGEATISNGHGVAKYYSSNGILFSSIGYRYGKIEGGYKLYYPNGKLKQEGRYKAGSKVGIWTSYSLEGKKSTKNMGGR